LLYRYTSNPTYDVFETKAKQTSSTEHFKCNTYSGSQFGWIKIAKNLVDFKFVYALHLKIAKNLVDFKDFVRDNRHFPFFLHSNLSNFISVVSYNNRMQRLLNFQIVLSDFAGTRQ